MELDCSLTLPKSLDCGFDALLLICAKPTAVAVLPDLASNLLAHHVKSHAVEATGALAPLADQLQPIEQLVQLPDGRGQASGRRNRPRGYRRSGRLLKLCEVFVHGLVRHRHRPPPTMSSWARTTLSTRDSSSRASR